MYGSLFCVPERILLAPIWENPAITRNGKPLKAEKYPVFSANIKCVFDLVKCGTNEFSSNTDLEALFNIEPCSIPYLSIF